MDFIVGAAENGFPFIMIHGTPGSYKATFPTLTRLCEEKGFKILSPTRAGYGGSSRQHGRSVVDFVAVIQAFNEHLGVKECVVGGWSGGGKQSVPCLVEHRY
jgi:pimeloyl-ACP methyl ester carboxylesterase